MIKFITPYVLKYKGKEHLSYTWGEIMDQVKEFILKHFEKILVVVLLIAALKSGKESSGENPKVLNSTMVC